MADFLTRLNALLLERLNEWPKSRFLGAGLSDADAQRIIDHRSSQPFTERNELETLLNPQTARTLIRSMVQMLGQEPPSVYELDVITDVVTRRSLRRLFDQFPVVA